MQPKGYTPPFSVPHGRLLQVDDIHDAVGVRIDDHDHVAIVVVAIVTIGRRDVDDEARHTVKLDRTRDADANAEADVQIPVPTPQLTAIDAALDARTLFLRNPDLLGRIAIIVTSLAAAFLIAIAALARLTIPLGIVVTSLTPGLLVILAIFVTSLTLGLLVILAIFVAGLTAAIARLSFTAAFRGFTAVAGLATAGLGASFTAGTFTAALHGATAITTAGIAATTSLAARLRLCSATTTAACSAILRKAWRCRNQRRHCGYTHCDENVVRSHDLELLL